MPLRDILLTVGVIGLLPTCFARPWIGILLWSWLGYMNPHKLAWGFARSLPFALIVALATTLGVVLQKRDRQPIPWTPLTAALAVLWAHFTLTTFFAWYPEAAWAHWQKVSKILLFTFLTLLYFQDRTRLRYLFLVIALSVGFYGLKGGIWSILTGGHHRVYGPDNTLLGSNNAVGLALNMTLPLLFYLARDEPRRWLRWLMRAMFWFSIPAILFTYSRGALLGLLVVLPLVLLKGRRNVLLGLASVAVLALAVAWVGDMVPQAWWNRMGTIVSYEADGSARGRLDAWWVATQIALAYPVTGGGFWGLANRQTYAMYGLEASRSAHSIYFSMLGDHGFLGLGIFLFLLFGSLWTLFRLRWSLAGVPDAAWYVRSSLMLEASLIAYMVSGAFISEAYFDLFYHLVACTALLRAIARREVLARAAAAPAARPRRAWVPAAPLPRSAG
jgi:probable O-glycosylation ligase (exosortase A-associated)